MAAMRLVDRDAGLLDRLTAETRVHYGRRLVALAVFGSVGSGTPREDSDVDLLVVARALPDGPPARRQEFAAVERRLGEALDVLRADGDHSDVVREAQELVELAMDGDVDFIPTERYSAEQAARAYADAAWVLQRAERAAGGPSGR